MRVAAESKEHMDAQDTQILALQAQVEELKASGAAAAQAAATEASQLRQKIVELESALYNTGFALHTAQVRC